MQAVEELEQIQLDDPEDLYTLRVALDAAATRLCDIPALSSFPNRATAELDDVLHALGHDDLATTAYVLYDLSRKTAYVGPGDDDVRSARKLLEALTEGVRLLYSKTT